MKKISYLLSFLLVTTVSFAQEKKEEVKEKQEGHTNINKFRQLKEELPTSNAYRTASGAPGHEYYQQKVDYKMDIILDDENQRIYGEQTITYHNNSPDDLEYLWVQLDQNIKSSIIEEAYINGFFKPIIFTA